MKLYLFKLGVILPFNVPVQGYLIQTNDQINILVDTGLPYSYIDDPKNPPGIQFQMNKEDYIVNRLDKIGLTPNNINYLICTHFDIDHAGNNEIFKQSEIIVQRVNYELDKSGNPRLALDNKHWNCPDFKYRIVEGDTTLAPGIDLVESSGHVPGHQSVLIDMPNTGKVLLAIDAIPAHYLTDPDTRMILPTDMEEAGVRQSTKKLMDLVKSQNVKLIVHGHDMDQWLTLKQPPLYYD